MLGADAGARQQLDYLGWIPVKQEQKKRSASLAVAFKTKSTKSPIALRLDEDETKNCDDSPLGI